MRITAWLLAALCVVPVAHAQSVIEWSPARRLTKSDFRGRFPSNAENASQSWLNIDAAWECDGRRLVATARATFDPARSWWRAAQGSIWEGAGERTSGVSRTHLDVRSSLLQRDLQLLEHEQLHFDLAEVAARKIRNRFEEMKDSCAVPGGTDDLQQVVSQIDRELQEEQRDYDRETGHGTNAVMQARWAGRIRKLLQ